MFTIRHVDAVRSADHFDDAALTRRFEVIAAEIVAYCGIYRNRSRSNRKSYPSA
ncbi:hypothetical protein SAMN03159341_113105 [Paenibacillus sp. 1_12]|uniref:hypothetical protein n=1 Tax=Paenibacillus sp. 1_12 TaxID=1566278 RepID=UPI0008E1F83F|nr:hypothetical protein [Paenibacillus sp. 1_12]SFL99030.1 hypothetical protein SAMN03159341_113105 [Paenibacillus sp. 1_12]